MAYQLILHHTPPATQELHRFRGQVLREKGQRETCEVSRPECKLEVAMVWLSCPLLKFWVKAAISQSCFLKSCHGFKKFRRDKYNKKISKYYVEVEEGDEDVDEEIEKEIEEDEQEVGPIGILRIGKTSIPHCWPIFWMNHHSKLNAFGAI